MHGHCLCQRRRVFISIKYTESPVLNHTLYSPYSTIYTFVNDWIQPWLKKSRKLICQFVFFLYNTEWCEQPKTSLIQKNQSLSNSISYCSIGISWWSLITSSAEALLGVTAAGNWSCQTSNSGWEMEQHRTQMDRQHNKRELRGAVRRNRFTGRNQTQKQ